MLTQKLKSQNNAISIGKNLQNILFKANPFMRFVGEGNTSSFGIIVESDENSSYPDRQYIVCVPKVFMNTFMNLPRAQRDVRKIITKKSTVMQRFLSSRNHLVDFSEEYSSVFVDRKKPHLSKGDDPYAFIRVHVKEHVAFSLCTTVPSASASPEPMFLAHLSDTFPNPKTKIFIASDYIKSVDSKKLGFCIGASGGINAHSLGSPVFDNNGVVYGMVVEILDRKFARCASIENILKSFNSLYEVRTMNVVQK